MAKRISCFGELLLRLGAPGRERLLQTPRFDVHVGGAEANVAVSLAHFGHHAAMLSVVPDNALGAAAVGELRRHGVDTRHVAVRDGRMGLYFLATGAVHRPSDVLYDRAGSAFANTPASGYDWARLLEGSEHLHVSGVTPAVGPNGAAAAVAAVEFARSRGLSVSFDGNFRKKLWDAWNGDARGILRRIVACADCVFADHRDVAMLLGRTFDEPESATVVERAAHALFEAFPQVKHVATTLRTQRNVDHHELAAISVTRERTHASAAHAITPIVDRIGGGDAFAAGVLHGRFAGSGDDAALEFGLAAACLKHSIPGDFNLAGIDDVRAFTGARRYDVRR